MEKQSTNAGIKARGIVRKRSGRSFIYQNANGSRIKDTAILKRIRSLAIPPAWDEVWISTSSTAHLQATGCDARQRKQYLYHPAWRASKEREKYQRILKFAQALPHIRRRMQRDLKSGELDYNKVLATIISLLDCSLIRIGNQEYARQNGSFGLTTLQDQHVSISSKELNFHFRGKSKKFHTIQVQDARLAKIVKECQQIPGRHLFQYWDQKHRRHKVTSSDVNRYLREISDPAFSAKDFRTWSATALMITALSKLEACVNQTAAKANLKQILNTVAARLGNTPAICRKSYIHPLVLSSYLTKGKLPKPLSLIQSPKGLFHREAIAYAVLLRLLKTAHA